jgi:hypothetical protein
MEDKENKKKLTKADKKKLKEELPKYLVSCIPQPDLIKDGLSTGSILNEVTNPMTLSSAEDLSKHAICFDDGHALIVKTEFIPYMIEAFKEMFYQNVLKHFKGDKKLTDDYVKEAFKNQTIEYFDLNDTKIINDTVKETLATKRSIDDKAEQLIRETLIEGKKIGITDDEKKAILEKLDSARDMYREQLNEKSREVKDAAEQKILDDLKAVEAILSGKLEECETKIDIEYMKNILEKHGPQAVNEELMRLDPDKRDELLLQLADLKEYKIKK